jgi:hypothetical protein
MAPHQTEVPEVEKVKEKKRAVGNGTARITKPKSSCKASQPAIQFESINKR